MLILDRRGRARHTGGVALQLRLGGRHPVRIHIRGAYVWSCAWWGLPSTGANR
jgi:hypothetical protein